jgi:autotransporter translocation and assembly factor TamB
MRSKILTTIGIFFLCLIILFIGLLIFSQTDLFRNSVRKAAEKAVRSITNQKFTIGSIEGNLISKIEVKDIKFSIENEPFVDIAELSIDYSLPIILDRFLSFRKIIPVDNIRISGLHVNLIKYRDGDWNFRKLVPEKEKTVDKKDVEHENVQTKWSIVLSNFTLRDSEIKLDERKKSEVANIDIPELELAAKLLGITRKIELDLKRADVNAPKQHVELKELSAKAFYWKEKASIKNLKGIINGGKVNFDGEAINLRQPEFKFQASVYGYKFEKVGAINAEIEGFGKYINPVNIDAEIKVNVPESEIFEKKVRGSIGKIKMNGTNIAVDNANVKTEFGEAKFSGTADLKRLLTKNGTNDFGIRLALEDISTSNVLTILDKKIKKLPDILNSDLSATLNTTLNIEGNWKEIDDFKAKATMESLTLNGKSLGEIKTNGTMELSSLNVKLDLASSLKNIDVASLLARENLKSNITANLATRVSIPIKGLFFDNFVASVKGEILPSSFSGLRISDGKIDASYSDKTLDVQTLSLNSDSFTIKTKGAKVKGKGVDLGYELKINDLNLVSEFVPKAIFKGALKAEGKVQGEINKPRVTVSADVSGFEFNESYSAKSIMIRGKGTLDLNNPDLDAEINANKISIKKNKLESVNLSAKSKGKDISSEVSIIEDETRNYEIGLRLKDLKSKDKKIEVSKLELNLDDKVLKNKEAILITIAPKKLIVDEFNIHYNNSSVVANGLLDFNGMIKADLSVSNLNLDEISGLLHLEPPLKGVASANIAINGTANVPIVKANIRTQNLAYSQFESDDANLDLNYLDKRLELKFGIVKDKREIFSANGVINADLDLKNIVPNIKKGTLNLKISSNGVDLSPLAGLIEEIKQISGALVADLSVTGKIERPSINGQLKLKDVDLRLHSLRNEFKIASGLFEFQGQKGFLRSAEILSDGGRGTFSGEINLDTLSYTIKGTLDDLLIKPKAVSANIDGNIELKGSEGKISIEGNLKIPRARIIIPEEPKKKLPEIKFVDEEKEEEFVIQDTKETDFFEDNVAINVQASIPRNTWIKGRGANIEIKGKFDIKKEYGGHIKIFGTANTVRGSYKILGKLFTIRRGTVSFRGQHEINPLLDIQALYEVSKVSAFINISGTAKKPEIKFSSDPPMEESDILSYIVFGTSTDKIGSGERNSLQGIAAGIAGGIAVNELKGVLGEELSPDVLRIGSGEAGTEVEVGKYLTDNLYVSYQRGAQDTALGTSTLTTDWVFIEYQIFNFLTLDSQAGGENSGADLFFNFNF